MAHAVSGGGFQLIDETDGSLWGELCGELSDNQRAASVMREQLSYLERQAQDAAKARDADAMLALAKRLPRAHEAHAAASQRVSDTTCVIARAFHPRAVDNLAWFQWCLAF
ncbi:hypothetical protein FNF31_06610 [Cafeteria roenbergensis]|uniref:Uncharacterized protein n=1 Tax=Cafeteria roenbergensis TaxID=33653 RepID=A0A5A8CKX5_CAFRO|nr:hypothetical protein FNF31_06610 [Cafeteria roenbergensis]